MTTLKEFEHVIRQLPPGVANLLRQILRSSPQNSGPYLLDLVRLMLASTASGGLGANWQLLRRALILLARLGRIAPSALASVVSIIESELAAAVAAGGGGSGAGGAAAGGAIAGLGTVLAILAAVLAVAYAFYSVGSEVMKDIALPTDGKACALDTDAGIAMALEEKTLFARGIGQKTALQRAIDNASEECAKLADQCGGSECGENSSCSPVASVIAVTLKWRFFWTTAQISHLCPCACLPND